MLTYAINLQTGEPEHAASADRSVPHACFICNTLVYPRCPSDRAPHYVVMPGRTHTNSACATYANRRCVVDPGASSPGTFHTRMLAAPHKGTGSRSGARSTSANTNDDDTTTTISSLLDIAAMGLDVSPETMVGNHILSDYIINSRNIYMVTGDVGFSSLGPRAIAARPDFCIDSRQTIRFVLTGYNIRMVFDWKIGNAKTYTKIRDKIFKVNIDNNTRAYIPIANRVLIHANWTSPGREACKKFCNKCVHPGKYLCAGYQYGIYVSSRSYYIFPNV